MGLRLRVGLIVGMLIFLTSCFIAYLSAQTSRKHIEIEAGHELQTLAARMLDTLDRGMFERLREVEITASLEEMRNPTVSIEKKRALLEKMRKTYNSYAWIGLAGSDGKGIAGTQGYLENKDLSKRPWFKEGLKGPYVGDVHDALLLAKLIPSPNGGMLYLLDVASPVFDLSNQLIGVLCGHIHWTWSEEILRNTPDAQGVEIFLLSKEGLILSGPKGYERKSFYAMSDSTRSAFSTIPEGFLTAYWSDGETYVTGFAEERGYRSYKGLGWRIVVRQKTEIAYAPAYELQQKMMLLGALIALFFGGLAAWFSGRIVHPLSAINLSAQRISEGELDTPIPLIERKDEIGALGNAFSKMVAHLTAEIKDRQLAQSRIEFLAHYDSLTGLPNRLCFDTQLSHALLAAEKNQTHLGMLFLDVDHFKNINNSLGHDVGDALLQAVADRLSVLLKEGEVLGRQGGDEFVLMLPSFPDIASIHERTLHLMKALFDPFEIQSHRLCITTSVGVAVFPEDGLSPQTLLRHAELAMYQAKSSGRNTFKIFQQEMIQKIIHRNQIEQELATAIEDHRLCVLYQPKVNVQTGQITGVEALVRCISHEGVQLSPVDFIPVAEDSDLILSIGLWVLQEACAQVVAWQVNHGLDLDVAVNVSVRQLQAAGFARQVDRILKETQLDKNRLELEITESIFGATHQQALDEIEALRTMGIALAIDDFGTGYSSLAYLQRLPVEVLKIDRAFVKDCADNENSRILVQTMISLAHSMHLKVVAEGVEDEKIVEVLKELGCDRYQGFYCSRPVSASELLKLI